MKGTGVFATESEVAKLKKMIEEPSVMFFFVSRQEVQKSCHAMALAHGLPEIPGYYGINNEGEFLIGEEGVV